MKYCTIVAIAATLFTVLVTQPNAHAQTSDGRDFYLGLIYPSFNAQSITGGKNVQGFYGVYAIISSYEKAQVTVGYFDNLGNEVAMTTYNVSKRHAIQVPLDVSRMKPSFVGDSAQFGACHITGTSDLSVQYFSTGSCSGGSYLALPTQVLGREYTVMAYHDNPQGFGNGGLSDENGRGCFQIIAAFGNTKVTIIPSTTTYTGKVGIASGAGSDHVTRHPYIVTLNRGQVYTVYSAGTDASFDISGTRITATKRIAVLAGNENGFVDGGDQNPLGRGTIDARDYMIEQMLPVTMYDTTGYVSLPLYDGAPANSVYAGDTYGIVSQGDSLGPLVKASGGSQTSMTVGPYQFTEDQAVRNPTGYYSENGRPFGMMQYQHRYHGTSPPFKAPSMMSIIPRSCWKSSYLFYVPNNAFEVLQGYYMNVICRKADYDGDSIMMAFNDTAPIPLPKNTANYKVRYNVIPTQPDLIGLTIPVGPGAYYLTTKGMAPFMAYNYGDRGIDPDRDIGDNDDDDFFFSYASPSGCAMPQSPPQFDVTVDTLCAQWHICVRTTNPGGAKISAVELLNDPTGDIYRPARVSRSVRFDPILDAANTGQVTFDGADSVVCFDIEVRNPWDTAGAVAYLLIHDVDGGSKLVDLHYKSPQLHSWVVPNWPNQRDSIIFPGVALQGDTCAKVYFYNKPVADANDIQIDAITVKHKDGHFAITNLSRPLPTRLHSGDTIAVSVCFAPKDQYLPNNSFTFHIDTLLLTTECFSAPITLVGSVGASAIYATDKDFGDVSLGLTTCDTVTIRNVGSLPLVLTDTSIGESLSHNHNFYWNPSSSYNKNRLPVILQPGQFIRASFCFSPTTTGPDSARVEWVTAQGGARKDSIKSYSILRGTGIKSGVEWDRRKDNWYLDSLQLPLQADHRVFLVNRETAVTYVDSVVIHGSDAAEFSIIENELGLTPLTRFPVEPGDSIYVVFRWMPDITTTYPARYRDRHAQLVAAFQTVDASGPSTDSTVMELNGTFDIQYKDAVRGGPAQKSDAVVYLLGTKLVFHLPGGALKLSQVGLYDFLGRRLSEDLSLVREGDNSYSASIGDLASGMYVVRYAIDGTMHSTVLMK